MAARVALEFGVRSVVGVGSVLALLRRLVADIGPQRGQVSHLSAWGRRIFAVLLLAGGYSALKGIIRSLRRLSVRRAAAARLRVLRAKQHKVNWKPTSGGVGQVDVHDVAIVGAGPAGCSTAFGLARQGVRPIVLERRSITADDDAELGEVVAKPCGGAVPARAQSILRHMGVLQELTSKGLTRWVRFGGMVSPNGTVASGNSAEALDVGDEGVVLSVRREHLDAHLVRAARRAGADVLERTTVVSCTLTSQGHWEIECRDASGSLVVVKARALVAADGSASNVGLQTGLVKQEARAHCAAATIDGKSHRFVWDGAAFFPQRVAPGFCALVKRADNDLCFCTFVVPGQADTARSLIASEPSLERMLGPDFQVGELNVAPMRMGGVRNVVADNLLLVGDAAGFIDPLTALGLHHALRSGELASSALVDALKANDLRASTLFDLYGRACRREFDFRATKFLLRLANGRPWLIDGLAHAVRSHKWMFSHWAEVIVGTLNRAWLLRPDTLAIVSLHTLWTLTRRALGPVRHVE